LTVVDASIVVDHLMERGAFARATSLFKDDAPPIAPDVLVFEVISAIRRALLRAETSDARASAAVNDLGDLRIELSPSLKLRERAWELRHNLSAGDALYVALAERLDEPLATRDHRLVRAAREHAGVESIEL
jgi:predicted nucleic acid-binding protein